MVLKGHRYPVYMTYACNSIQCIHGVVSHDQELPTRINIRHDLKKYDYNPFIINWRMHFISFVVTLLCYNSEFWC